VSEFVDPSVILASLDLRDFQSMARPGDPRIEMP